MVSFVNTLDNKIPPVDFKTALFKGQPANGELFTLDSFPEMSLDETLKLKGKDYSVIAANVISKFANDIQYKDLLNVCKKVYNFEHPIEEFEKGHHILRLDRGPTASFKDNAAVLMAGLMDYYLGVSANKLVILTATSGDTGSAVANAYYGSKNIDVVVLFPYDSNDPKKSISTNQRLQMTTLGSNIYPIGVKGNFDACQDMVTKAFSNLGDKLSLGSANSINVGRLIPQMIYYFDAFARLYNPDKEFVFSVPSGNFGDLTAGLIAKFMGLPAGFIAGVNGNSYFPELLETGKVNVRKGVDCSSSAMSVTKPSNMRRIFYMYEGRLNKNHEIIMPINITRLRDDVLASHIISETEVDETIKWMYNDYGLVTEPHGAVALAEWRRFAKERNDFVSVSFETAHPAKFPEKIRELLGITPEPLPNLKRFIDNASREYFDKMEYNQEVFEKFLLSRFA